jgi:hypothetical protein
MTTGLREKGLNPPPRPSTPKGAPWSELEQLHEDLQQLSQLISAVMQNIGKPGAAPIIIQQPGLPTPTPTPGLPTPVPAAAVVHERIFTATGGNASVIMVNGASWETNMWQAWELEIVDGPGVGQYRRCLSNTRDQIVPRKTFDTNPESGSVFVLRPRYPMDNPNSFATLTKIVTLAITPEQLTLPADALTVPNGWPILLIALTDNAGDVFFALSSADSLLQATRFERLEAGKSVCLFLTKTDLVWIAVDSDGDGVSAYVPQWVAD